MPVFDYDMLSPPAELEAKSHKLKRLVQVVGRNLFLFVCERAVELRLLDVIFFCLYASVRLS
jgi:hypothetical protein